MSDNTPSLDIQVEVMKRLPVKSLIQFRSVSKTWKSIIHTSDFIAAHLHHTQQHCLLVCCDDDPYYYVLFADNDTFPQHKVSLTISLLDNKFKYQYSYKIVGTSRGLLCFYSYVLNNFPWEESIQAAVIWNPCIRKLIRVDVPHDDDNKFRKSILGFGVCPTTNDPKIIIIRFIRTHIPSQVEVFTLSTKAWRSSYNNNLPPKYVCFQNSAVNVDGFLYWFGEDMISLDNVIISFDLTSEEFRRVNLPDSLARYRFSISNLRGSLVLSQVIKEAGNSLIYVWLMEGGVEKSFSLLYSVNVVTTNKAWVRVFRKSGEPIIEVLEKDSEDVLFYKLGVYDPYSKHINCFWTGGMFSTFDVYPYMETLLLLDQTTT